MRLLRVVWGRLRTDWAFLLACWLLVVTAITLVSAGALYADTVELGGVRRALIEAEPADQGVSVRLTGEPGEVAQLDARLRDVLNRAFGDGGADIVLISRSSSLLPARDGQPGLMPTTPIGEQLVVLGAYQRLVAHASLVEGRWPAAAHSPLEGALSQSAATALGLQLGSRLQLADAATPGADPATVVADVQIVGIWRPNSRADPYWLGDALDLDGKVAGATITRGPVIVAPEDLAAVSAGLDVHLDWRALPIVESMSVSGIDPLRQRINAIPAQVEAAVAGRSVATGVALGDVLGTIDRSAVVSRSGVVLVVLQFAVLAGYAVLLAGALLAERRRPEVALLRARGGRSLVVGLLAIAESAALATPATLVAPLIALAVVNAIGHVGAVGESGIVAAPNFTSTEIALTALAGLAAVLVLSVPALIADVDLAHVRAALGRPLGRTLTQRVGLDVVLVVATVIGLVQLQTYGSPVSGGATGQLTTDPALIAAPALALATGALLVIRLVPRIGELAERAFRRQRGLTLRLTASQVARQPLRYTRVALLIVLAAALATFAATYAATWAKSQADQATYQAGADVRVEAGQSAALKVVDARAQLEALPGVRLATPVSRGSAEAGHVVRNANVMVLDAPSFAANVRLGDEAATQRARALLNAMAAERPQPTGIELPPGIKRLGAVFDVKVEPTDPGVEAVARPSPGQGFEVAADVALASGRIVTMTGRLDAFEATDYRVELISDPIYPTDDAALKLVHLRLEPKVGVPMSGFLTLDRVEATATPSGPTGWTTVVEAARLSDWSFGQDGPSLMWSASNPICPPDVDFCGPSREEWAPELTGPTTVPVIASDSFLAAAGSTVGDQVSLIYHSAHFDGVVAGSLETFPSLAAARPFLLVELASMYTIAPELGMSMPAPDEWWLWVDREQQPSVVAALTQPPFEGTNLISQVGLQASLERDPVALGLVGALSLGSLAAAVCAAVGLIVGAIVSSRERLTETALLRAMGLSRRGVASGVLLDNGYLLGFGLPTGIGLGVLIGQLVLPHMTLSRTGALVVPPPVIVVPSEIIITLAAIGLALLVITVISASRVSTAAPVAATLREGED